MSFVFGLTAFFPLLTLGSALLLSEKKVPRSEPRAAASGVNFDVQIQQVRPASALPHAPYSSAHKSNNTAARRLLAPRVIARAIALVMDRQSNENRD